MENMNASQKRKWWPVFFVLGLASIFLAPVMFFTIRGDIEWYIGLLPSVGLICLIFYASYVDGKGEIYDQSIAAREAVKLIEGQRAWFAKHGELSKTPDIDLGLAKRTDYEMKGYKLHSYSRDGKRAKFDIRHGQGFIEILFNKKLAEVTSQFLSDEAKETLRQSGAGLREPLDDGAAK
jgi:hypothetical protein